MKIKLNYKEAQSLSNFQYEIFEEEKSVLEALYIARNAFGETQKIDFSFFCLGENWPFSIWDLPLVCENLPEIIRLCNSPINETCLLWFYEQGIDRKIKLTKMDSKIIKLENAAKEKWPSRLELEILEIDELKMEVQGFAKEIKNAINVIYPKLNELEMLKEWYKSILE